MSPGMDSLMLTLSGHDIWWGIALGAILVIAHLRTRRWYALGGVVLLTLAVSDVLSTRIIKPWVDRPRPCYELGDLRLPSGCGGRQSFPSNHSSNAMAITTLMALHTTALTAWVSLILVLAVGFSRIYLGVHYPSDVLMGFFQGAALAWLVSRAFHRYLPPFHDTKRNDAGRTKKAFGQQD